MFSAQTFLQKVLPFQKKDIPLHRKTKSDHAKIAQLVEHNLAKVGVAGSSPVFRSNSLSQYNRNAIVLNLNTGY